MRLLQVDKDGQFSLTDYIPNITSPYAILSHTWGDNSEEVSFKDLIGGSGKTKAGYRKLRFCAEQAARDGLQYFWVDTCCINKDSSAELSEAIVSMFRWYQSATRCYVYLSDISVADNSDALQQVTWEPAFRQSRWFTRGWTLQELIAPRSVQFFSKDGKNLGDKESLERQIHEITGIAIQALRSSDLSRFTVAERMIWASNRKTTREEDKAYCLLGICEIFILPMYGEGQENAFYRLREEIDKRSKICECHQAATFEASREGLTSWLQPASVGEDLRELLNRRYVGTCRWILDKAEFKGWRSNLSPVLWLHGKPGSGKSVLTAALVEHLQKEETVTAYFFCGLGDDTKRTLESILRTWLWQILEQLPQFTSLALQHRKKGPGICSQLEMIENALREITLQSPKIIYLIVDGFDECESGPVTAEKLIAFVSTLGEKSLFAIISRPENWIRKAIYPRMEGKCCNIPVTNEATEEDLDRWIRACILEMRLSDSLLEQLAIRKLQQGADGMFLWARFQLEALEAQFAVEDAKAVLQNELPKDLEATYERLLTSIEMESSALRRARAFRILQWITAANRPLTLTELDFALGIQVDSMLSPKHRSLMRGKTDVLDACGSFVEITKAGQIRFVHASAKDFLSSKGIQFGFGPSHSMGPPPSQGALDTMYIARACITCLSFSDIDMIGKRPSTLSQSEERLRNSVEKYPFLEYAAMNWWKHLSEAPYTDSELLQHTIRRLLGSSESTLRWLYLYQYLLQFHHEESELLDPTATSCWKYISDFWNTQLGPNPSNLFNRWQRWHVEMRFDPGILWPPLHIAAFFNFADMVEQELKHGVPADLQNELKFTAILQAAHGDSAEAAQALIDHGAYLQAETRLGYTAVRYACRNSLSTLPLLLKAGSRADRFDHHFGQTALHEVAGSVLFHPKILSTLLNIPYISDIVNVKNATGNTALDCAAAINLRSSASRVYDRSYDGIGGIKVLDGWGTKLLSAMTIGDCFSAQGTALSVLHQGWREAGVRTPMDSTYESVLSALTAWKAEIIQRLLEKGAKSALEMEHDESRTTVGRKRLERA
jgi:hypothetical protein